MVCDLTISSNYISLSSLIVYHNSLSMVCDLTISSNYINLSSLIVYHNSLSMVCDLTISSNYINLSSLIVYHNSLSMVCDSTISVLTHRFHQGDRASIPLPECWPASWVNHRMDVCPSSPRSKTHSLRKIYPQHTSGKQKWWHMAHWIFDEY